MSTAVVVRLRGYRWHRLQQGYDCNRRKIRQRCARLLRKGAAAIRSERRLLSCLFATRIATGYVQGGWQREVIVGSVGEQKMCTAVEGIREIGWLKGWWTEGCDFLVRFVAVLGAIWGYGYVEFWLQIGIVLEL
ncbi:hypothetical protein BHE74_00041359 [Ensete ventricosum]|nr:hypothetical protein BHE74_00041359 [Ensete ventricosum]